MSPGEEVRAWGFRAAEPCVCARKCVFKIFFITWNKITRAVLIWGVMSVCDNYSIRKQKSFPLKRVLSKGWSWAPISCHGDFLGPTILWVLPPDPHGCCPSERSWDLRVSAPLVPPLCCPLPYPRPGHGARSWPSAGGRKPKVRESKAGPRHLWHLA